jgi:hypothetical protein
VESNEIKCLFHLSDSRRFRVLKSSKEKKKKKKGHDQKRRRTNETNEKTKRKRFVDFVRFPTVLFPICIKKKSRRQRSASFFFLCLFPPSIRPPSSVSLSLSFFL